MGITIPQARLRSVLERAAELARSSEPLPEEWLRRTQRIGECPSKTYVAAFGTALLAKATNDDVDALAVKASAGPNAYSMRSVVKVLVDRARHHGYHLGATRREPLNNQPWFRISRVDEPVAIKANARPFHRDLIRYLRDLDELRAPDAMRALSAFLRVRMRYADEQRTAAPIAPRVSARLDVVARTVEHFLRDDPEDGRRGQALAAAVLDLLHDQVELSGINDPTPIDVRVRRGGAMLIGVEVKQKPVGEHEGIDLAATVATAGADKALLLAFAEQQQHVREDRIRRSASEEHGVLTITYQNVGEFVSHAAAHSRLSANEFAQRLPEAFLRRMEEQEVSIEGRQYWLDLLSGLAS